MEGKKKCRWNFRSWGQNKMLHLKDHTIEGPPERPTLSMGKINSLMRQWRGGQRKKTINQRVFHNLQSHLACQYIKMCALIRYSFYKSLFKICATKHNCRSFLWCFFRHGSVFPSYTKQTVLEIENSAILG